MEEIQIPVSPGELLDKISILQLKVERIQDRDKQRDAKYELGRLRDVWDAANIDKDLVADDYAALLEINARLWDIEDGLRAKESVQKFDQSFIEQARMVYITNDKRAEIKLRINTALGSRIREQKSYKN